ncbi:MAG: hypothetical protein RIQ62_362, partial [Bacteroidota bacterium]
LPLYYRLQLTSIYAYLQQRIGIRAYKTGALFFIISRTLGATARLYLVVNILQLCILNHMGISFGLTSLVILLLILLYTFEGGVKTIVYTDTLQTSFMLLALVVSIVAITQSLHLSFGETWLQIKAAGHTTMFNTEVRSSGYFLKQILGGAFITIGMTGLDQEMMQKNISVNTLRDSQKNMLSFSTIILLVNFLFLFLGACLYLYALQHPTQMKGDDLFPAIAMHGGLPAAISILFIIGLISALFPSADGALTALTSSFCIDILGLKRQSQLNEKKQKQIRLFVHFSFALLFFICVMIFKWIDDKSIIDIILKIAGYTYGPLLGLFSFGILTKRHISDRSVLPICLIAPVLTLLIDVLSNADWFIKKLTLKAYLAKKLNALSATIFDGYKVGIELLIINGVITFLFLWLLSQSKNNSAPQ